MWRGTPVDVITRKLEFRTQAVPVHLNLVAALIQAEFQRNLARLECVHIGRVHCQHVSQPLNLQNTQPMASLICETI